MIKGILFESSMETTASTQWAEKWIALTPFFLVSKKCLTIKNIKLHVLEATHEITMLAGRTNTCFVISQYTIT